MVGDLDRDLAVEAGESTARAEGPHPPRRVPRGKCLAQCRALRVVRDDAFIITRGVGCNRAPVLAPLPSPQGDWWALGAPSTGVVRGCSTPVRTSIARPGSRAMAMTPRHDALLQSLDSKMMEASERPMPKQHVADLAALKAISEFRQSLAHGSPEWGHSASEEDGLIARVVAWAAQRPAGSRRRR